jgi:hypothetical protein
MFSSQRVPESNRLNTFGQRLTNLFFGNRIWSAATCRRFPAGGHVCRFQSADVSAHSKNSTRKNLAAAGFSAILRGP